MRYGIISDIHSNLEALEAVLERLSKERIDKYVCPGDIVGYGADPKKCIKIVRGLDPVIVCGNHDAGCAGLTDISYFNDAAKKAVIWTKNTLDTKELDYLAGLDFVREEKDFTLVHGTLQEPQEFLYMLDFWKARDTFDIMKTQVCFIGHSHVPGVFIEKDGKIEYKCEHETKLKKGSKYIVNAGSVGQPRDGDNRACFCVYDPEEKTVRIERAAYDIKSAQEKILKEALPPVLASRLGIGA